MTGGSDIRATFMKQQMWLSFPSSTAFKSRMDYEADIEGGNTPVEMGRQSVTLGGRKGPGCERRTGQRSHHLSEICGRRPLN